MQRTVQRRVRSPAAVASADSGVSFAPPPPSAKFDYVIVGAGAAGCALAARLSEDANVTVLLLEAGEDLTAFKHVAPALASQPARHTDADWRFDADLGTGPPPPLHVSPTMVSAATTTSHDFAATMSSRGSTVLSRGKTLGGTAALGNLLHVRGDPAGFDAWAAEEGCEGWDYDHMLPYFKRSEALRGYSDRVGVRGAGGPMPVGPAASGNNLHRCTKHFLARANDVLAADANLRLRTTAHTAAIVTPAHGEDLFDYNGPIHVGAGVAQVSATNHRRCDPAWAYLQPSVLVRPNLHVSTGVRATRIIFEGDRATGVRYCCPTASGGSGGSGGGRNGSCGGTAGSTLDGTGGGNCNAATAGPEHSALATREVLVCAGAVGSSW